MIPHVSELAGLKPPMSIPVVETMAALEQVLPTVPTACQWLLDNVDNDGCVCRRCLDLAAMSPDSNTVFTAHGPFFWYATATAWRAWSADMPLEPGFMPWHYADEDTTGFWSDWPPLYRRFDDHVIEDRAGFHLRKFVSEGYLERLSDDASQVSDRPDDPLTEYWRGRALIGKARASGARGRALDALRAVTGALEPHAVNDANKRLLDPLRAALEAAQT